MSASLCAGRLPVVLGVVLASALTASVPLGIARADGEGQAATRERVTLTGKLVCVGCALEKQGAEAQCTLHAKHAQGFLAEDGTLYTLLDNARGHLLITEKRLRDQTVKLEAYRFPRSQVLEVVRYQLREGEAFVQYDYCKSCGFEKGDNGGKDVCHDCAE